MSDDAIDRTKHTLPLRKKVIFACIALLLFLVGLEVAFRALGHHLGVDRRQIAIFRSFAIGDEDSLWYRPHAHLSFVGNHLRDDVNSLGFRDREHALGKAPGVIRIACLGASTTFGGNVKVLRVLTHRASRRSSISRRGAPSRS